MIVSGKNEPFPKYDDKRVVYLKTFRVYTNCYGAGLALKINPKRIEMNCEGMIPFITVHDKFMYLGKFATKYKNIKMLKFFKPEVIEVRRYEPVLKFEYNHYGKIKSSTIGLAKLVYRYLTRYMEKWNVEKCTFLAKDIKEIMEFYSYEDGISRTFTASTLSRHIINHTYFFKRVFDMEVSTEDSEDGYFKVMSFTMKKVSDSKEFVDTNGFDYRAYAIGKSKLKEDSNLVIRLEDNVVFRSFDRAHRSSGISRMKIRLCCLGDIPYVTRHDGSRSTFRFAKFVES